MELTIAALELEILVDFLDEALEHLEGIEEKILQLESSQNIDLVNSIFRPAHTIKGTASFLGLNDIKYLAHELETLLDDLRNDKIKVSSELIDTLLDGVDTLAKMLREVQESINKADQTQDPIALSFRDVDFAGNLTAIQQLKDSSGDEQSASSRPEEDNNKATTATTTSNLLSDEELKAISYPMEMDIAFVQESREHLENLEQSFLDVENSPENIELLNDIFRDLHSLKGGAGVLVSTVEPQENRQKHPITVFQALAHEAEGLIQEARDGRAALSASTIEILLTVVDRLAVMLNGFVDHNSSAAYAHDLIEICRGYRKDAGNTSVDPKQAPINKHGNASQMFALSNTLSQTLSAIEVGLKEIAIHEKRQEALGKIGRALTTTIKVNQKIDIADLTTLAESMQNTAEFLGQGTDSIDDSLISSMTVDFKTLKKSVIDWLESNGAKPGSEKVSPTTLPSTPKKALQSKTPTTKTPPTKSGLTTSSSIKVPQERLDVLMNLVGELIISKNHFPALAREITVDLNLSEVGKKVKSAGDQVGRITDELQNIVMKMRMLPVGSVFSKFKRLVRDLAKNLDKDIILKLSGEETELDKTIIETLGDPMVHLIRNCADHALEGREERTAKGKPPEGTIHLKAFNQGQNAIIEIIDDGRGIDPDYIRLKAVEKGYLSIEELEGLDDQAVQNLIFRPGFSGAKEVTEVSGRGVGMDVVRTNVEKIGGTVSLRSEPGIGTTITITLPLTLAVSKGLEVKAAHQHYYLPLDYIEETVKISPSLIRGHKNSKLAVIRGTLLPVFSLAAVLCKDTAPKKVGCQYIEETDNAEEVSMVVLNMNGKKAALAVDDFYTESEYVIKPLSGALAKISGISGATITSSGQVILILDPLKLL